MSVLDRCKQITDTESGRVLLYRDEVEAVLSAGDTISRRQAIEALGDEPEVWSGKDEYAQGLNNQWHYDRNAIKALPSAQPELQWIPCSERLPEEKEECYWVCLDSGGQCQCRWTNDIFGLGANKWSKWGWSIMDKPMYTKIVAWMPLPEPYMRGEQE